ncbi:MAG: type II secretion system protein [Candidatus Omnitrophota bacterium]
MTRKSGFTLIEIVISIAILAIGLLGVLSLFPVGFDAARRSVNLTQAAFYAQEKLAQVKKDGFPELTTTEGDFTDPSYSWHQDVKDMEPKGYLREVDLTVTYKGKTKQYNQTFTTYVAKYSP